MTGNEDGRLIDASQYFLAKTAHNNAADVHLRDSGMLTPVLAGQQTRFIEYVGSYNAAAAAKLLYNMPGHLRYAVTDNPYLEESLWERESRIPEYDRGITEEEYEIGQRDRRGIWLYMSERAINQTAQSLDRFMSRPNMSEEEIHRHRLQSSGVMLASLAFGKWAFEILNPHHKNSREVNQQALTELAEISGFTLPSKDEGLVEEAAKSLGDISMGALDVEYDERKDEFSIATGDMFRWLKHMFAGRVAYDGLISYTQRSFEQPCDENDLIFFQAMCLGQVREKLRMGSIVSMYDLSLAKPLPPYALAKVFDALIRL